MTTSIPFSSGLRGFVERMSRHVVLKRRFPERFGGEQIFVSPAAQLRYWRPQLAKIDPELLAFAEHVVTPGAVVWDIGANIGLFSFAAASRCGSTGRVLAVEPDTWLVSLLRRSNRLSRRRASVEILPAAISDRVGIARLNIAERSRASNFLEGASGSSQAGGVREKHEVMAVTLDWLSEEFPLPDVLKIDVEGLEYQVLAGAHALFAKKRPVLLIEVTSSNVEAVTKFLQDRGYLLYDLAAGFPVGEPLAKAAWNTVAIPG